MRMFIASALCITLATAAPTLADDYDVTFDGNWLDPQTLTIRQHDTVTFTYHGNAWGAIEGGDFGEALQRYETYTASFPQTGTFAYTAQGSGNSVAGTIIVVP